jgi:hypothetical protein
MRFARFLRIYDRRAHRFIDLGDTDGKTILRGGWSRHFMTGVISWWGELWDTYLGGPPDIVAALTDAALGAWSADDSVYVTLRHGVAVAIDPETGVERQRFREPERDCVAVAVSDDGRVTAVALRDGRIVVHRAGGATTPAVMAAV